MHRLIFAVDKHVKQICRNKVRIDTFMCCVSSKGRVKGWMYNIKRPKQKRHKARAGAQKKGLALVWATPRAGFAVIGVQLFSTLAAIFSCVVLS